MRSSCASFELTPACQRIPRPARARMISLACSGTPKKSASLIEIVRAPQLSISRITSSTGRRRTASPFISGSAKKVHPWRQPREVCTNVRFT